MYNTNTLDSIQFITLIEAVHVAQKYAHFNIDLEFIISIKQAVIV